MIASILMMLSSISATAQKYIVISTKPAGARVIINGRLTNLKTPAEIKNPGGKQFTLGFQLDGYDDAKLIVGKQKINGKTRYPLNVNYQLNKKVEAKPIKDKEENIPVSRENPGKTSLEQTIIRYYFDSDPRGARIYWRVVSSIPAIVKNTNETYLMTTPFEETRAFNILGLTYENSRDVQIEIKVSKKGYEDQIKRYNVRQAIDQQEISGFFELIAKETQSNND